jgi:hypothetical protein
MKFKRILTSSLLAGAMLALPMTAPTFAEPAYSANSNYVEQVDWWHHDHDGDYAYRNRGYGNRYDGYGYGRRGACGNAQRLQNQASRDRRTGHPAAGSDVAQQAAWARSNCYRR